MTTTMTTALTLPRPMAPCRVHSRTIYPRAGRASFFRSSPLLAPPREDNRALASGAHSRGTRVHGGGGGGGEGRRGSRSTPTATSFFPSTSSNVRAEEDVEDARRGPSWTRNRSCRAPVGYRIIWWLGAVPWSLTRVRGPAPRDAGRRTPRLAARNANGTDGPTSGSCERVWRRRLARRTGLIGTANSCGHSRDRERGVLAGGPPGGAPGGGATNAAHTRLPTYGTQPRVRTHVRPARSWRAGMCVHAHARRMHTCDVTFTRAYVCVCARGCSYAASCGCARGV